VKLYILTTPSLKVLRDEWFIPSLKDDFHVVESQVDQHCPIGTFMSDGWRKVTQEKARFLVKAVKDNMGEAFLYSDVDIQFFRPVKNSLQTILKSQDMAIQRDTPWGTLCSGFMACRANERTLRLFSDIADMFDHDQNGSDQAFLNHLLLRDVRWARSPETTLCRPPRLISALMRVVGANFIRNRYGIRWVYLPSVYFSGGTDTGRQWSPGDVLPVPDGIALHHANWTCGVENKISQLTYVRDVVARR